MQSSGNRVRGVALALAACAALMLAIPAARPSPTEGQAAASRGGAKPDAGPEYTADGQFKLPADYQSWVFVGSNLGVEYRDDAAKDAPAPPKEAARPPRAGNFHNVYINPEAYAHYARTGKFPERTILMLDIFQVDAGEPGSIVAEGLFPGKPVGVAAAVKNSARPDGGSDWAYYDFGLEGQAAKAFPDKACYECHLEHASDDNVWVQFYPTLRRLKK